MQPTTPASASQPEFPFGWRYVKRTGTDGNEILDQIPLTLEDVLHPEEGDVIPENPLHESDCRYLADVFSSRPFGPPLTLVTRDLLVNWGVSGIRNHSPDVAVFVGLEHEHDPAVGVLDLKGLGGRCEVVVEVVSPSMRNNDVVAKFNHYHRVGVPFYVIVDQVAEGGTRSLRAYKRKPDRYVEVESDDRNRIDVPLLGLIIGMSDNRVVCYDLKTERELGDYARIVEDLKESQRLLEAADRRAEQQDKAIEEQVEARQAAERRVAEIQKDAERQRQEKLRAQQEADKQRQEADKQRQEADKQRQEKLRAQQEADRRRQEVLRIQEEAERQRQESERQRLAQQQIILEMQEKMRLLQAGGPPANPPS